MIMKKVRVYILVLHCFLSIGCLGQSCLLRVYASDNSIDNYLFEQRPIITFVGDSLNIQTTRIKVQCPVDSIVKYTTHECPYEVNLREINIDDDKTIEFYNDDYIENCSLHYKRTFLGEDKWETIYLPFDIDVDSFKGVFDFSSISNIRQYDENNDGEFDRMELEIKVLKQGILKANYPYLIKTVSAGKHEMYLNNAVLVPTEIKQIDCSSVDYKFLFYGCYSSSFENGSSNIYSLQKGYFSLCSEKHPFRWYMSIKDRFGEDIKVNKLSVVESGTVSNSIGYKQTNDISSKIYSIEGMNVDLQNHNKKGVYIIKKSDGSVKKVLFK